MAIFGTRNFLRIIILESPDWKVSIVVTIWPPLGLVKGVVIRGGVGSFHIYRGSRSRFHLLYHSITLMVALTLDLGCSVSSRCHVPAQQPVGREPGSPELLQVRREDDGSGHPSPAAPQHLFHTLVLQAHTRWVWSVGEVKGCGLVCMILVDSL